MKKVMKVKAKVIELPNQKSIRTIREEDNNKYLGQLEGDIIKQMEK